MINLKQTDPRVAQLIAQEKKRQRSVLRMIPSENYVSDAVLKALGSILTNKYSEGYPGKRYYQGNQIIDQLEALAIRRACRLFQVPHANLQALSGAAANAAVYFGLLKPGDKLMGMNLACGGHLTHGHPKITFSGRFYQSVQYGVDKEGWIDYQTLVRLAKKEKPKLIISGFAAYPRLINFKKFKQIADSVGAILLADISHIAGLVISGVHPSPVPYAHVVTTTTHKTLRGPRGAIILVTKKGLKQDPQMAKKIDRAVFPGLQGGPHDNQTAAIAVCLKEASTRKFKNYSQQVVKNAKTLAKALIKLDFNLITKGTDNHLILLDVRNKRVLGQEAAEALEKVGIIVNKNSIPYDPNPPTNPSGIRLGTPAITTQGLKEKEMIEIAKLINQVFESFPLTKRKQTKVLKNLKQKVKQLIS